MTAQFHSIHLKDRELFESFLGLDEHRLCVYAFPNIYIWKGLFEVFWSIIDGHLCVFFQDAVGCFMYLPPLGKDKNPRVFEEVFDIMEGLNKHAGVSRIENAENGSVCKKWGYGCVFKSYDYLCKRTDMAELRGDKFKSKRAGANYFKKNYRYEYAPFLPEYKRDCMVLYNQWMRERTRHNKDAVYTGMMRDSRNSLGILLRNYERLHCTGRVVRVGKEIKAFTFGFPVCKDTFCILYEITDLSLKGLSQFIFKSFCEELQGYTYINIMDDSGLDSLKRVKLSYHPAFSVPAYIVTR